MPLTEHRPVTEIEGIGPSKSARLAEIGVYTTDDLLRVGAAQIHDAAPDIGSVQNVHAWRDRARLLQIPAMTGQWAEALNRADVDRLSATHTKDVAELRAIFTQAETDSIIPAAPDDDLIFAMIRSALEIDLTGMLVGTVTDRSGNPLDGATLRIGIRRGTTDARGRFRMLRISLGVPLRLTITADGHRTLDIEDPPVLIYQDRLDRVTYALDPRVANEPIPRLDEYDGDELPRVTSHVMRSVRHDAADLREGDLFVLHKFYKRTPDVLIASKYWAYEEGEFIVRTHKLPADRFPSDVELRQHFLHRGGTFKRVTLSPSRMRMYLRLRRARKAMAGRPVPSTPFEWDDRIRAHAAVMAQTEGDGSG